MRGGDGTKACALLTASAAESLAPAGGACASALLELRLPGAGRAGEVVVWGNEAQVRLAGDTLFLHRSPALSLFFLGGFVSETGVAQCPQTSRSPPNGTGPSPSSR
ncbi:hypothetical protein Acor_57210 [Acrocarpospora corrugata]|uniref:Uncharacterized protein n=1 Tax=Acrocarpospora corrugata TaxID=35763 RepID=A0A5M3W3N9_9ACTN|nr:hypothetical protein Acor_57210 [Acrocarpospora corrugata]